MNPWKKYFKKILPEAVCFCMGMIVLVQYCSQQPRFSEPQRLIDNAIQTNFKSNLLSHLSEVEEVVDKFISKISENPFTQRMQHYIKHRFPTEKAKEEDVQKSDINAKKLKN